MAQRIFITATNTDIGKTYATKLLIKTFSEMGYRVAAIKPIETGVIETPLDGSALLDEARHYNPELATVGLDDVVPIRFELPAAPYVANHGRPIDLKSIDKAVEKLEKHCEILLIEGAGGLLVPIDPTTMIIDLVKHFDAKALLVSHARLGCINDTLLNLNLLEEEGISHTWAINLHGDKKSFETVSEPYFLEHFDSYYQLSRDIEKIAKRLLKL